MGGSWEGGGEVVPQASSSLPRKRRLRILSCSSKSMRTIPSSPSMLSRIPVASRSSPRITFTCRGWGGREALDGGRVEMGEKGDLGVVVGVPEGLGGWQMGCGVAERI